LLDYDQLIVDLRRICNSNNIHIEDIPKFSIDLMRTKVPFSIQNGRKCRYNYEKDQTAKAKVEDLPAFIFSSLLPFQRDGVKRGIKLHGRILINNEYGTGKTLVAIALCLIYRSEWPLLVICPKTVRFHWKYEFLKWLPLDPQRI